MTIKQTKTFYPCFTEEDLLAITRVHNMACDLITVMETYACYGEDQKGQFMVDASELNALTAMLDDMKSICTIVPY